MWGWLAAAVRGLIEALGKILSQPLEVDSDKRDPHRRRRLWNRVRKARGDTDPKRNTSADSPTSTGSSIRDDE